MPRPRVVAAVGRGRGRSTSTRRAAGDHPGPADRTPRGEHRKSRRRPRTPHAGLLRATRRADPVP